MSKTANRFLEVDPWVLSEKGFHPDRSRVSESIFSLGNEYMGVRGYFEEGYSGTSMPGSYFNGVFEEKDSPRYWFRGVAKRSQFMINTIDWLHTRIRLDGQTLDLAKCKVEQFERRLDLRTGILTRRFIWKTAGRKRLRMEFTRFLSMAVANLGCQRVTLEALNFSGPVDVEVGLTCGMVCESTRRSMMSAVKAGRVGPWTAILGKTAESGHHVFSAFRLASEQGLTGRIVRRDHFIGRALRISLKHGKSFTLDRIVTNLADKNRQSVSADVWAAGAKLARAHDATTFDAALARHVAYWKDVWNKLDVTIEGDDANQQGVRFCIFQLHQTYHGVDPSLNIGAKGLTGESYAGRTFWDTETYCLPFYMFNQPRAARNLLEYRYRGLPAAVERAKQLDCRGARYPWATIDGTESNHDWQHGDLEIHVPGAVAYGIWHYVRACGDREFLYTQGIEMLLQISRYYASRGQWSPLTGEFGLWGVMGADEFHMMVHNNCYTNVIAKKAMEFTLQVVSEMAKREPKLLTAERRKVGLKDSELADWRRMARKMRIPQDKKTGIFEQHDGYFDLPHIDCKAIPPTQFPLYGKWAYVRIFRYDMIKQPDFLLLPFFFSRDYSLASKRANYRYYEERCVHESSLSPSIHSILAAELGLHEQAYAYWKHAARLDLDDYNRNTQEGLHTTSMASAWLNVVYGFGGMRSDGGVLSFNPSLPAKWKSFAFRIFVRGSVLGVNVDRQAANFRVVEGGPVEIEVFSKVRQIDATGVAVPMPEARLGRKKT